MSSQPTSTGVAPVPADQDARDKKGISKVLSRMKTVFRKGETTNKRSSALPPTAAAAPAVVTTQPSQPAVITTTSKAVAPPAPSRKLPSYENATRVSRIQIHEERARNLGSRFGLEIKPSEFHSSEGDVLRVEKLVRMRIHRACHKCNANFGKDNQCPACQHQRCKQCTRYPVKRDETERDANRRRRDELARQHKEMMPIVPSYDYSEPLKLTRPSRTGGQDLVYKKIRQRVRRKCHKCDSLISAHSKQPKTCDNCGHKRCDDCPRDPSERKKYPYGYPNDEPGQTFKGIHRCHECRKRFPANVENETECRNCSHKKCDECPRVKPKKVEPEPDADQLEKVRLRLEGLTTEDS